MTRHGETTSKASRRSFIGGAVAGLAVPGVIIENPGCVSKTYPNFFEDLARLVGE